MRREPTVSERISREARVVGLRGFTSPSLEAVERRRMQLWILAAVLLVALSTGAVALSLLDAPFTGSANPGILRLAIVLLSIAFCVYAIEKELHLRRLARLLVDERVLTTALSNRLHEVSLLLEAGKAMNSVLELEVVLDVILRGALELLSGTSGSVMLLDNAELVAASVRGNDRARGRRVPLGEGIAGHVALTREPLLIEGPVTSEDFPGHEPREQTVESAMCAPLMHRGEVLGVLNVNADHGREFTEYDLRALSLFAEQAAGAIANARLYETELQHVAKLLELDRLKSEFVALVSHELRTPLTSILAAAETARRPELRDELDELIEIIVRQGRRLSTMVEDLLTAARLEKDATLPAVTDVDVAALVRLAARDFEVAGRPVVVVAPDEAVARGTPDSLRRVIDNLVDNAHKYGAPPVRVVVEPRGGSVLLSVIDAGPGVPEDKREWIFERFARMEDNRDDPGLGLGLPVVRGLVLACGGAIRVEDGAGGGAAFRVWLPVSERVGAGRQAT
ncbi:MAG TPA: ATP-binding protein [Actinomycetota bacterium]|nr:ATP-binding protein [Actinomycetota bacterium]